MAIKYMGVDGDGGANPIGCKYTQHSHDIRTVLKQHLNNLFVHVAKGADISSSLLTKKSLLLFSSLALLLSRRLTLLIVLILVV